jgi:hypothetical protein
LKGPEGGLNRTKYRTPLVPTAVRGLSARTVPFSSTTLILNEPGFTDSPPATVINALAGDPTMKNALDLITLHAYIYYKRQYTGKVTQNITRSEGTQIKAIRLIKL